MDEWSVKAAVRARDGNKCTDCGMTAEDHRKTYGKGLDVHRVVPGSQYTVAGCVTLCRRCHGPKPKLPRTYALPKSPTKRFTNRLIIDTTDEVRAALKSEIREVSARRDEDVSISDFVNELLRKALSHRLTAEGKGKPKK